MSFLKILCMLISLSSGQYSKQCNPMDYGGKGDGKTDDTSAIQKAMNDCYLNSTHGLVVFPSGKSFLSFALNITDVANIGIEIQLTSTLVISNDRDKWPGNQNFIQFTDCSKIEIFGGGLINGQGEIWWQYPKDFRPHTIDCKKCNHLLIRNITIIDPPNHCMELGADNTELSYVTVLAPLSSDNTDAVDVHGSPFWIHDCYFDNGDDNVAVHANDTLVENCRFGTGHGASIGSLGGGWYKNITFNNIQFNGTTNGIRIKTHQNASDGKVWDVHYTNLNMNYVKNPIIITQLYDSNSETGQSNLYIDGVYMENITSKYSGNAGQFLCQNSTPCHHIQLNNVHISNITTSHKQMECQQAYGKATDTSPASCLTPE